MLGWDTFKAPHGGKLTHLQHTWVVSGSFGYSETVCQPDKWLGKVYLPWSEYYHEFPSAQEANAHRAVTCENCKGKVGLV